MLAGESGRCCQVLASSIRTGKQRIVFLFNSDCLQSPPQPRVKGEGIIRHPVPVSEEAQAAVIAGDELKEMKGNAMKARSARSPWAGLKHRFCQLSGACDSDRITGRSPKARIGERFLGSFAGKAT